MNKLERIYGIKVDITRSLDPENLDPIKSDASRISNLKNFNIDNYDVYFHCITIEKIKPTNHHTNRFSLDQIIELLQISFCVNKHQRKKGTIKLYNRYFEEEDSSEITTVSLDFEMHRYVKTSYFKNNKKIETEIITFIDKQNIRSRDAKISINIIPQPTKSFQKLLRRRFDFNPTIFISYFSDTTKLNFSNKVSLDIPSNGVIFKAPSSEIENRNSKLIKKGNLDFIEPITGNTLILFIHGLHSSGETWYTNKGNKILNILLKDAAFCKERDFALFNYYTKISNLQQYFSETTYLFFSKLFSIFVKSEKNSQNLGINDLSQLLGSDYSLYLLSYSNIYIVAHSMGTLITRKFILNLLKNNRHIKIKKVISIASPILGSNIAWLASKFSKSKQLEDMKPNSNFISELASSWNSTEIPVEFFEVHVKNDQVVIYPNTKSENIFYTDDDHNSILNPKDENSSIIALIKDKF